MMDWPVISALAAFVLVFVACVKWSSAWPILALKEHAVSRWLFFSAVNDTNPIVWTARNTDLIISGQTVIGVRLPSGIVVRWD